MQLVGELEEVDGVEGEGGGGRGGIGGGEVHCRGSST